MRCSRIFGDIIIGLGAFGSLIGMNATAASPPNHMSQTSRAQVNISNGGLSLDSIPDFSFTNLGSSDEYRLHLADPNPDNKVQVTDYRKQDAPGSQHPVGWRLNVSVPRISSGTTLRFSNRDTTSPTLTRNVALNSQRPTQDIMGNYHGNGYGVHDTYFAHPGDAIMTIPNSISRHYQVDVDWDLSTPLDSDVNRG